MLTFTNFLYFFAYGNSSNSFLYELLPFNYCLLNEIYLRNVLDYIKIDSLYKCETKFLLQKIQT